LDGTRSEEAGRAVHPRLRQAEGEVARAFSEEVRRGEIDPEILRLSARGLDELTRILESADPDGLLIGILESADPDGLLIG